MLGFDELSRDAVPRRAASKKVRDALRLVDRRGGKVDPAQRADGERHARGSYERAPREDGERLGGEFAPSFTAPRNRSRASAFHFSKFAPWCAEAFHFGTSYD